MATPVYNVGDTATQVLAMKQAKENIFVALLHREGIGIHQVEETNATTIRMMKSKPSGARARKLGASTNGGFFNADKAKIPQVNEYDLNLLFTYDQVYDLPEVQQDICPINIFDQAIANISGEANTEINASTLAVELAEVFNLANTASDWENLAVLVGAGVGANYLDAILDAGALLDDGDKANGIQSFPFDEREIIMRSEFERKLMGKGQIFVGGSNYAQSMLAKGTLSPETTKDFGKMYIGEVNNIPCFLAPAMIWDYANDWTTTPNAFDSVLAVCVAGSATDRGISFPDRFKIIDSPDGAGKRIQPLVRWGVNVCYAKGIVPILKNGTSAPVGKITVEAPASQA